MKKRILAIVLTVLMLLSAVPLSAVSAAVLGDVDGDGSIKAADARIALRASVGLETLDAEAKKAADADLDGEIKAADARLILRASVGLENLHSHSYTETVTTPASCEAKGVKTFTCSCGDSFTEEIAATGHKTVTDKAVAATCTKTGLTEGSHCSVCNTVIKAQTVVAKTSHTVATDKAVAATCTKTGLTEGSHCSVCNTVIKAQTIVAKTSHTVVTDKAVAATCTKTGLTEGSHCSVCNTVIKAQTRVEATGHKNSTLDVSTKKAETCSSKGYTGDYKCDVCGVVTAKGTDIAANSEKHVCRTKTVEASCTSDSYTVSACIYCDYFDTSTIVESGEHPDGLGHSFGTATTVPASCGNQGYDTETCSVCTYEHKYNFTDALEHDYKVTKRVRATCLATGYEDKECKLCGDEITVTLGIAACKPADAVQVKGTKGGDSCYSVVKCSVCEKVLSTAENYGAHTMLATGAATEADCENPGVQHLACQFCDYTYDAEIAPANGHSNKNVKAATCEEPGYIISSGVCTVCNKDLGEETRIDIPAKGHRESGVQTCTTSAICLECGMVTKPELGHNYTMTSSAITTYNKTVDTFFCTRCGEAKTSAADKLETFNAVTDKIKTDYYGQSVEIEEGLWQLPRLHTFGKVRTETTYTDFDFGIYTSMIEDMYKEEMNNSPDEYRKLLTANVKWNLPLNDYTDKVSLLTADDVDSITVERLSGADFNSILSGFDTKYTAGKTEYDLTPYKSIKVNGNVIRVTIDVKNEKYYGGIQNLTDAEMTSLQKIFDIDVRDDLSEFEKDKNGKLYITESEASDGYEMSMTMYLTQLSTDGKVVYYFLEETYEPIIAIYDAYETMEQSISMSFKIGLSIKGTMAPVIKSQNTTVFVFPAFTPAT